MVKDSQSELTKRCTQFYRLNSTVTPSANNVSECPVTGTVKQHPKLVKTKTLPFFGSSISWYSQTPEFDRFDMYMYSRKMREKFGEFFSFGRLPMGSGLHGTIHVLIDPEEMLKVVRSEGAYPSGAVSNLWLFRRLLKNNKDGPN